MPEAAFSLHSIIMTAGIDFWVGHLNGNNGIFCSAYDSTAIRKYIEAMESFAGDKCACQQV
eukprot:scaffold572567_cov16-Prasinocladus_malaysianus.AAC.1